MGFEVIFRGRDESVRFNANDKFSIEGGALTIKRSDGTASIYSPSVWEIVEVDRSEGLPPGSFGM